MLDTKIQEISKEVFEKKSLLVLGRGYNYATCLEGALVILTPLYIVANMSFHKIRNYIFFLFTF